MVKLLSFEKQVACETQRLALLFAAILDTKHPLCDVILRVPGSETESWVSVGSNSALLRMKSSVLDAMWQSDSSGKGAQTIDIADCSEEAIRALNAVAFGQLHAVEITAENVAELLYAALKYDFKLVVDCCQQFIEDVVAKDDVSQWLRVVSSLCEAKLTDYALKTATKCRMFGSKKTSVVFKCEAVTTLPFSLFRDLLSDDALVLSEDVIWKQCVKWSKHNCDASAEDLEDVKETDEDCGEMKMTDGDIMDDDNDSDAFTATLRSLKEYIRFPLMSHEFFMKEVGPTGILSEAESWSVCKAATGLCTSEELFCKSVTRRPSFDCFAPAHFQVHNKGSTEVLRVTGERRALFGCSKGWRTGVHKMRFRIDRCTDNNFGFGVSAHKCEEYLKPSKALAATGGVSQCQHTTFAFWGARSVFTGSANHFRFEQGQVSECQGGWSVYKEGDCIELVLDCNEWTLSATHNGDNRCVHALIKDKAYFPCVHSMCGKSRGLIQVTVEFLC